MVRECARQDVRIVCASRPGYDGSPRKKGRSYADNAADTRALLDFLGVKSTYVMGHSGGGGPALADGALNHDWVQSVAVVATFAPRYEMGPAWRKGLDANEPEIRAHDEGESRLREELEGAAATMAKAESAEDITAHPDFPKLYSPVDQACFEGEFLDFVLKARQDGGKLVEGWVDDDFALFGHWRFDLDAIRVPVSIWQGRQDRLIPVAHAEWLNRHIPGSLRHLLDEEGHVSLLNRRFSEILEELRNTAR
jgi:pimeloyl-ACP methyl ester carboxylesterase